MSVPGWAVAVTGGDSVECEALSDLGCNASEVPCVCGADVYLADGAIVSSDVTCGGYPVWAPNTSYGCGGEDGAP